MNLPATLEERFCQKVEPVNSGCWFWHGHIHRCGYARFGGKLAHRVAYELLIGPIPADKELDHLCRNKACVNPWHLEPVTHIVNCWRGFAPIVNGAFNRRKTHCPKGHPYNKRNTYISPKGTRVCRICRARKLIDYRLKKKFGRVAQ